MTSLVRHPAQREQPLGTMAMVYPETDGKPVGESDQHLTQIFALLAMLRILYRDPPDVYVAADLFLYYEEGNPQAVVAPDLMVVRGVDKRPRRTYLLWQEGQVPACVIEVTSRASRLEHMGTKRALYALLGVPEYFVFDPLGEYLAPPLVRFRLVASGEYQREDGLSLESEQLGLTFAVEADGLRLYDQATGNKLLTPEELARQSSGPGRAGGGSPCSARSRSRACAAPRRTGAASGTAKLGWQRLGAGDPVLLRETPGGRSGTRRTPYGA